MDAARQRERDVQDLKAANAECARLAGLLRNVEQFAVAVMATLEAVAPEAAADLRARLA